MEIINNHIKKFDKNDIADELKKIQLIDVKTSENKSEKLESNAKIVTFEIDKNKKKKYKI